MNVHKNKNITLNIQPTNFTSILVKLVHRYHYNGTSILVVHFYFYLLRNE